MNITESTAVNTVLDWVFGSPYPGVSPEVDDSKVLEALATLSRSAYRKLMAGHRPDDVRSRWALRRFTWPGSGAKLTDRARAACRLHTALQFDAGSKVEAPQQIIDLIANLNHYADELELDWEDLLLLAETVYLEEKDGAEEDRAR